MLLNAIISTINFYMGAPELLAWFVCQGLNCLETPAIMYSCEREDNFIACSEKLKLYYSQTIGQDLSKRKSHRNNTYLTRTKPRKTD